MPEICWWMKPFSFYPIVVFVAKRYVLQLQQKCLKKWIGSAVPGTLWYNVQPPTPTMSAAVHSVTDRQTDRQTTAWCQQPIILRAAVRSAKTSLCRCYMCEPHLESYAECTDQLLEFANFQQFITRSKQWQQRLPQQQCYLWHLTVLSNYSANKGMLWIPCTELEDDIET